MAAVTGLYSSGQLNEYCNTEYLKKGMRENILSNIHQVGSVGGGYVFTTPQKNIVYHTYIKEVSDDVKDAVIMAGTDKGKERLCADDGHAEESLPEQEKPRDSVVQREQCLYQRVHADAADNS